MMKIEEEQERISAIVVNQYGKGRAVHFNFNAEKYMVQLDELIGEALRWLLIGTHSGTNT